ncbi:MAG: dephospho-CoA kinase, partial [Bacteroidota bacterium]|nr:dephospho-CoA kinase [Bacteroidota bacterium]
MIKVGLTGNIGSGKSTVAKVFETLGVPVYYSDLVAKKLLTNPLVIESVVTAFGDSVVDKNGV